MAIETGVAPFRAHLHRFFSEDISMDLNANDIRCLTHILHIKILREKLFHLVQQPLIISYK